NRQCSAGSFVCAGRRVAEIVASTTLEGLGTNERGRLLRPYFPTLSATSHYLQERMKRTAKPPFVGSNPTRASNIPWVRPGDIGYRSYRRHRLHFWAKRVVERLQSFFLQIDVPEIVVHKAHQPDT